ncbi:MAG TPA: DUF484 family protein [Xanthomonadaceae bacterium]|nr:DUF484 family protein [Xanthomonadaceae bacterium]
MTDIETRSKEGLNPQEVAGFLRRHPDFLKSYPDLALALAVPRDSGQATSLASYQLEVLRDQNRDLKRRLHELVEIAGENEQLMIRVHSFTLSLMRAASRAETLKRAVAGLTEDFATDLVRVVLFSRSDDLPAAEWLLTLPRTDPDMVAFREFLDRGEPLCGRLQTEKLAFLFGARADGVRSSVLLPLGSQGMLAIGSVDPNRFHPGMGTVFLKLMAEAMAAALARYGA